MPFYASCHKEKHLWKSDNKVVAIKVGIRWIVSWSLTKETGIRFLCKTKLMKNIGFIFVFIEVT